MISFSTNCKHLLEAPTLQPQFMRPDWLQTLQTQTEHGKTAKTCPGFAGLFKMAMVVPMWCDISLTRVIERTENTEELGPMVADRSGVHIVEETNPPGFHVGYHDTGQTTSMHGNYGIRMLPKPLCPWYVTTPPGWSILVLPASLHGSPLPYEPIPGVINTDEWHQMHMPCRWTREPGVVECITAGTPFAYWLPFERKEKPVLEFAFVEGDELIQLHGEASGA